MSSLPYYKIYKKPELEESSLIVCWEKDAGRIGTNVFNYLSDYLNLSLFCEIEPRDFFTLGGVMVENNIARFPQTKLYSSDEKNIVVLYSTVPRYEWYRYISLILEIAQKICRVAEIYTVGGMISVNAHTSPRVLMATMNINDCKTDLQNYDISLDLDYETPPGQRPTMSSYLLWEALRRNIRGVSLWVPVPFYLVGVDDLPACKKIIDFMNHKFKLGLNMDKINEDLKKQNIRLADIIQQYPDLQELMLRLEENSSLSESESGRFVEIIEEQLRQNDYD